MNKKQKYNMLLDDFVGFIQVSYQLNADAFVNSVSKESIHARNKVTLVKNGLQRKSDVRLCMHRGPHVHGQCLHACAL